MKAWLAALMLLVSVTGATAAPPAERQAMLRRGINITGWFRFPGSRDPAALTAWIGDTAIADLRDSGFSFVRLAFDPALTMDAPQRAALIAGISRLQRHSLAVVVSPHPLNWTLETTPQHLLEFWRGFAPALRPLDPALTFPEVINEPVFPHDPAAWGRLQHATLLMLRGLLPQQTIVLTGQDWGSIAGLLALTAESDPNVAYSFHFYDPAELTSLAAWRPGLDRSALTRLPFPVEPERCPTTADGATAEMIKAYCLYRWDAAQVATRLQSAERWAAANHAVLVAGEFGATTSLNREARLAWLETVRVQLERGGMGWALWGYDDAMGFAVPRPVPAHPFLDPGVLSALGLPHRNLGHSPE